LRLRTIATTSLPAGGKLGGKLGDLPVTAVTLDVVDAVMGRLDETRARRAGKAVKPLRSPSRRQYAQTLPFLLGVAASPMRLIAASPIPKGWLPRVKTRVRPILYPLEELQTMSSSNDVHWRMFFGFLSRTGFRADEAAGLQLRDLNFDARVIELDENKTDDPRAPTFDASLFRALQWWKDTYRAGAQPTDSFFVRPDGQRIPIDGLADHYRETFLRVARVGREKLFRETDLETKVCAHSCRANFVTYSLAEGKTETWIADRTGHRSSLMINRYRRRARNVVEAGLGFLSPLDQAIPEVAAATRQRDAAADTKGGGRRTAT
jgi:integrase